jgi:hypothetical protein
MFWIEILKFLFWPALVAFLLTFVPWPRRREKRKL